MLDLIGWDGIIITTVEVAGDKFTDWLDFKAAIEFNEDNDTITLHYYCGGEYISSATKEMTTKTNAINSICITGYTTTIGSGLMIDDIAFGYTANGAWNAPIATASEE